MVKRLIAFIAIMAQLLCMSSVIGFAEAGEAPVILSSMQTVDGEIYHTYILKGTLSEMAGRQAKLIAYKKGTTVFDDSTVLSIDQCVVGKDGAYTFDITLKDEGTYIADIKFAGQNKNITAEIEIKGKTEYIDVIALFNDTQKSEEELAGYVDTYSSLLGFDTTFFNKLNDNKILVGRRLKNYQGTFTADNINEIYNKEQLLTFVKYLNNSDDLVSMISLYDDVLFKIGTQSGAKNIWEDFLKMPSEVKRAVTGLFGGTEYQNFDIVRDSFNRAVLIGAYNTMGNSDFLTFIKNNNDYLNISELNVIDDLKADAVLTSMHNGVQITTKDTFVTEFKKVYALTHPSVIMPPVSGNNPSASSPSGSDVSITTDESTRPVSAEGTQASISSSFTDLDGVLWAKDAILGLYEKGIVNGKANGIYAPLDYVTREEFAKILVQAFGIYDELSNCAFTDVSEDDWSYKYISSAKKHELIKGYNDGNFGAKLNVTRQDMAVMIYRALVTFNKMDSLESIDTDNLFSDEADISEYAKNSVIMLNNISLIMGNDKGEFLPASNATRAEVAVLISRAIDYIK